MLPAIALLLMLLAADSIAGEGALQPGKAPAPVPEDVRALVRAPLQKLGTCYKDISGVVGQPVSLSSEEIPNTHQPSQIDRITTIRYDGLVIRTYEVSVGGKEMLLSVRMTRNRPGILPLLIGASEKSIKATYGGPRYLKGNMFVYVLDDVDDTGEDAVNIEFENSLVVAVEWNFYVD